MYNLEEYDLYIWKRVKNKQSMGGYGSVKITGEFRDKCIQALKDKNVIRAKTLFNTDKFNYQVLEAKNTGSSKVIKFMRLSRPIEKD